jgi:prepilin-type N-terminal cleavage/methylation domain-containing protein
MSSSKVTDRGFTLSELMLTVAVFATIMAMAVPLTGRMLDSVRLNGSARDVERELQTARLKAVSKNRRLRVALNCPSTGQFRIIEFVGSASVDNATNRCSGTAYPSPPTDNDPATRPNFDGPIKRLAENVTVTTARFEFRPDGTAYEIISNTPTVIASTSSVVIAMGTKTKTVTVNALGKINLQ